MSKPLWDKGVDPDAEMLRFTKRDDSELDNALLVFDLRASRAHVKGLSLRGLVPAGEADSLIQALNSLESDALEGRFRVTSDDEDGHSAIESQLTKRLGDVGRKVHLGRSRNDQVLVAMRLYERSALSELRTRVLAAARAFLGLAHTHQTTLVPGYTHLQRAVPSTLGLLFASYVEGFVDSVQVIDGALRLTDGSPLGTAAGYGVNLDLDRDGVARELGFRAPITNPIYTQTSRGTTEVIVATAAWHPCAIVRRLAWDFSLFSTAEFGFLKLDDRFTTGSSIMPNKKNPDVIELFRASASVVEGAMVELMQLTALPSGYHRDLQLTKAPIMRALNEATTLVGMVCRLPDAIEVNRERMASCVTSDLLATDRAVDLAKEGVPFREAYRRIASELGQSDAPVTRDAAEKSLRERVSLGGPGRPAFERIALALDAAERGSRPDIPE